MIVPRYYEDLCVLHDNTMMPRAYYVPASARTDDLVEHRENSDRLQMLNGNWKFRYYDSIYEVTEAFYAEGYDTSGFDGLAVPSLWQMAGYDTPQYVNIRYPFPFDPPYVPQDVPCGAYVHTFHYQKKDVAPMAFLNFEGVDSCFYVWLNGRYVGYSQVSHTVSEFDVTTFLKEGKNTIGVLVLKWCDGSYLEDQDKFRMSGIFRDVYLLKRPKQAVRDYHILTDVSEKTARIRLEVSFYQPVALRVTVEDQDGMVVAHGQIDAKRDGVQNRTDEGRDGVWNRTDEERDGAWNRTDEERDGAWNRRDEERDGAWNRTDPDDSIEFEISHPVLWNTEAPYLYSLIIESGYETIEDKIALRTIEVRDRAVYFNGERTKFRGVNRHESDPETGAVVTAKQIRTDLTLMKQHNFNAIRTSHYPNVPYFYQMCERYGFLVIDEADIEAHGAMAQYQRDESGENFADRWSKRIADDPLWEKAILDRVQRMVLRDKNRFCIVMWSMGNESAYGCNFEKALEWTKRFDPNRLTQYESARYRKSGVKYQYGNLDLYSRMYASPAQMQEYLDRDADKPFLLVEYCHSMGNGPGDLEDYFQMIQKDGRMCGGFVWEWCDHGIAHGKTDDGRTVYYYGGDHGEALHDGNFCVDGLVYPDRTPHTGLLEYKNVYRPARVVSYDESSRILKLHNYMDFDDLKDYVSVSYEVTQDGTVIQSGSLPAFSVKPHCDGQTRLHVTVPKTGRVYAKLFYRLKKDVPLLEKGHILGVDEILLHNEAPQNQYAEKKLRAEADIREILTRETDTDIIVSTERFTYTFDRRTALLKRMQYAGEEYLNHPAQINIWRAPTDNDMYRKEEWKRAHYHEAYMRAYETHVCTAKHTVVVSGRAAITAASIQQIMDVEIRWEINAAGKIFCEITAVKDREFPELPRFGIRLFLDKRMDEVRYYGMGPQESYRDKHRASCHGLYHSKVCRMHEDYIRPQENGSHYDCDFVELASSQYAVTAASDTPFSFQVSHYTQEELERASHNYELTESDSTVLCLDYALNGIGSNSCGPDLLEKYRLDETEIHFSFALVPFEKDEKESAGFL